MDRHDHLNRKVAGLKDALILGWSIVGQGAGFPLDFSCKPWY